METVSLSFEEFGAQNSETVVILHGFFASSRNWRRIAEHLSESYRVLLPDMRNHGNSPHHPVMGYPEMAGDMLRFLDERGLDKVDIVGHSMGGKIAMWLALQYPDRLDKLIVVDIAPKSYEHSFDKLIQALIDLPVQEISSRKQAETILADAIPDLSYRQFLLQNLVLKDGKFSWRIDLSVFKKMAPKIIAFPETDHFANYSGKTLFFAGEYSSYVVRTDIEKLFPFARLQIINESGHWLHVQQPELFLEKLEKFMQSG